MDLSTAQLVPGIIALIVGIIVAIYARGFILRSRLKGSIVVYDNLKLVTAHGSYQGAMYYLISIVTAVLGPLSYKLISLTVTTYIFMNIIAALFFVAFYPYYAPMTSYASIDVIEKEGTKFCIVGKVMIRKFKVITISENPNFEIIVASGRKRLKFEVASKSSSQMSAL